MAVSLEELNKKVEKLRAIREIENIMGRYSFMHTALLHKDYLQYWSKRDDDILDMPWGGYSGYEGVERCYLEDHGDRYDEGIEDFLKGLFPMHTHTTGVIEVAEDLQTARGVWMSPGQETFAPEGKGDMSWGWSRIGADFIQEDGVWKIWRMRVYGGIQCDFAIGWVDMPPYEGSLAEAHIDRPVRSTANYHPDFIYPENEPMAPEPYKTYDEVGYQW